MIRRHWLQPCHGHVACMTAQHTSIDSEYGITERSFRFRSPSSWALLTRNECPHNLGSSTACYQFSKKGAQCLNRIAPNAETEDIKTRARPTNICLQSPTDKPSRVLPHENVKGTAIPFKPNLGCILNQWTEQCLPSPTPLQWQENRTCSPPQGPLAPTRSDFLPSRPRVHRPVCLPETA